MSKVCRLNIGKTNNLEAKIEGFFFNTLIPTVFLKTLKLLKLHACSNHNKNVKKKKNHTVCLCVLFCTLKCETLP